MRSLKDIYSPYQGRVNVVLVGMDLTEGPERLQAYRDQQGYPWQVTVGNRGIIVAYNVLTTATKFVIDADGVIVARDGYGVKSADGWRQVLSSVAPR